MASINRYGSKTRTGDGGSPIEGSFHVIEPTMEAAAKVRHGHGSELLVVTIEEVEALLDGKAWGFTVNGGEYFHFVVMKQVQET